MDRIQWKRNTMAPSSDKFLSVMDVREVKKAKAFHESFPQYSVTPLVSLEKLADYIKFQIEDIEKANLKVNEEEDLKEEFNMLANAEKISNSLVRAYGYLNSSNEGISILEGLSKVISQYRKKWV